MYGGLPAHILTATGRAFIRTYPDLLKGPDGTTTIAAAGVVI
jgi:hypothetical protein